MADPMQQAREQFEAWAIDMGLSVRRRGFPSLDLYRAGGVQLSWLAWQAALRAAPEGFVLVPVEPTEEMNRAGAAHVSNPYGLASDVWAAMLAARPQGVKDGW